MEELKTRSRRPTAWTWIGGTILVIAIIWTVFAMIARRGGSHNQRLPGAQIRRDSMVASVPSAACYTAAVSADRSL